MKKRQAPAPKDKVYLAWVHTYTVHEPFARSMMEACLWKPNGVWGLTSAANPRQEVARNAVIKNFLETEGDWLMWVDTDMTFEYDSIERLLKTAREHKADMIAGLGFIYKRTAGEIVPNGYLWYDEHHAFSEINDYEKGKVYDIDGTGSGFALIHRRVFEAFDDEYWHETWREHPYTGNPMGHDLAFCWRAKQDYGMKIVWDTNVKTGHIKPFELVEENFDSYRESLL